MEKLISKKASLIAILILIAGIANRCAHLFLVDSVHEPFRLGGLFVAFAEEIANSNFRIPVTIPYYSSGGIPFAYPPLGFFFDAVLLKFLPARIFVIANLIPPLISVFTLILVARFFYHWAGGWNLRSLSALTAYALLPNSFFNQIEAAGLAEAFGSLAIFVYLNLIIVHQQKNNVTSALSAGLGLALCIYSSPGSALGAVVIFIALALDTILSLGLTQKAKPYLYLLSMGITGAVLSAPYWLTVILNHGVGIFLTPLEMQYQTNGANSLLSKLQANWFTYSILQQGGVYFWNFAVVLGMVWLVWKRKLFMPLVFLALFSIPRENTWLTAFPVAILVSYGVTDVLAPRLKSFSGLKLAVIQIAFGVILLLVSLEIFDLVYMQARDEYWKLYPPQIEALYQAREIIPPSMPVIVLGNGGLREWAPYLLQREVLNTEFGLEWQPDEYRQIMMFNQALNQAESWRDIENAIQLIDGQSQIYVVVDPNRRPDKAGMTESGMFLIKMNTPELAVGVLGLR